jgi:hypothetical protein
VAVRELGHSLGMQTSVQLTPAMGQADRKTPVEKSAT